MSRRKSAVKRTVLPDARYDSQTVSKFINNLMIQGKKSTAEGIFYGAMDIVEAKTSQPGVGVFKQALNNLKPVFVGDLAGNGFSLPVANAVLLGAMSIWAEKYLNMEV